MGLWSPAKAADEDDDDEVIDIAPGAHSILIDFVASFGLAWFNICNLVSAWRQQNQKPLLLLLFSFVATQMEHDWMDDLRDLLVRSISG